MDTTRIIPGTMNVFGKSEGSPFNISVQTKAVDQLTELCEGLLIGSLSAFIVSTVAYVNLISWSTGVCEKNLSGFFKHHVPWLFLEICTIKKKRRNPYKGVSDSKVTEKQHFAV